MLPTNVPSPPTASTKPTTKIAIVGAPSRQDTTVGMIPRVLLAPLVVILACCQASPSRTPTAPPQRVVSLVPAVTDLLMAIGAQGRLVGRATSDTTAALANLPAVGQVLSPNLERLLEVQPDLVIVWDNPPVLTQLLRLEEHGIALMPVNVQTLDQLRRQAHALGALLGLEPGVDSVFASLDRRLATVEKIDREPRPRVAYIVWDSPLIAAGAGSYPDELIGLAGGLNLLADVDSPWPQTSLETLVARNPDVVVWNVPGQRSATAVRDLQARAPWNAVAAIRAGRIFVVHSARFDTPSAQAPEAVRQLAEILARSQTDQK